MNKERCDQTAMAVPNPTTTTSSTTKHQNSHDVNIVELQTTHYSRPEEPAYGGPQPPQHPEGSRLEKNWLPWRPAGLTAWHGAIIGAIPEKSNHKR